MPFFERLYMQTIEVKRERKGDNVATAMMFLGLIMYAMIFFTGCTGGRLYIGFERHDFVENAQKATDGNFLCGVMGYCREGEKKQ